MTPQVKVNRQPQDAPRKPRIAKDADAARDVNKIVMVPVRDRQWTAGRTTHSKITTGDMITIATALTAAEAESLCVGKGADIMVMGMHMDGLMTGTDMEEETIAIMIAIGLAGVTGEVTPVMPHAEGLDHAVSVVHAAAEATEATVATAVDRGAGAIADPPAGVGVAVPITILDGA